MVTHNINKSGIYSSGIPIKKYQIWRKNIAQYQRLDKITNKLKKLEQQIKLLS